jgi:hypothetical protein
LLSLFLSLGDKKIKFDKTNLMVLILRKGAEKKEIEAIEKKLYPEKSAAGFNAEKYNGALLLSEDPLTLQKRLRDEWERTLG